jgi:hypothetical protein
MQQSPISQSSSISSINQSVLDEAIKMSMDESSNLPKPNISDHESFLSETFGCDVDSFKNEQNKICYKILFNNLDDAHDSKDHIRRCFDIILAVVEEKAQGSQAQSETIYSMILTQDDVEKIQKKQQEKYPAQNFPSSQSDVGAKAKESFDFSLLSPEDSLNLAILKSRNIDVSTILNQDNDQIKIQFVIKSDNEEQINDYKSILGLEKEIKTENGFFTMTLDSAEIDTLIARLNQDDLSIEVSSLEPIKESKRGMVLAAACDLGIEVISRSDSPMPEVPLAQHEASASAKVDSQILKQVPLSVLASYQVPAKVEAPAPAKVEVLAKPESPAQPEALEPAQSQDRQLNSDGIVSAEIMSGGQVIKSSRDLNLYGSESDKPAPAENTKPCSCFSVIINRLANLCGLGR